MRLGKYTTRGSAAASSAGRSTAAAGGALPGPRPFLTQFRDRIIKNMVLESLSNLKWREDLYGKLIFAHDLTPWEREECKKLVQDTKKQ